uniref:Uncharacterized protein n=1 Tax=Vespula pensylvanica TaxID=30213 RepID=A0A834P2B6_VESPE|nr:hypothetical protein H0235_008011 [Vespula pensylvanica]
MEPKLWKRNTRENVKKDYFDRLDFSVRATSGFGTELKRIKMSREKVDRNEGVITKLQTHSNRYLVEVSLIPSGMEARTWDDSKL